MKGNKKETTKERAERLQKEVDEYKEYLSTIDSIEKLNEEEKKCIEALDEYDKYLNDVKYDIPNDVTWEGKKYSRQAIVEQILYFINKLEVQWSYTLGLYQLYNIWRDSSNKTISYKHLDSTLRILEQPKFKGYSEWRDILMINEYMKQLHEQYTNELSMQIALGQKHNAVLERIELITPVAVRESRDEE